MKTIEWVKEHYSELEKDTFIDRRWTKRFLEFVPSSEWERYGFKVKEGADVSELKPIEWTEENVLKQLKADVEFGYEKAFEERGISSELMAMVVDTWCIILENGCNLGGDDGWYHMDQFKTVAEHYGWSLSYWEEASE